MRLISGKTAVMIGMLGTMLALSASAAPAFACVCGTISFTQTTSSGTPYVMTSNPQTFGPSGNSITYSDFGNGNAQYMYVTISGITAGWSVVLTSSSTVTTISNTAIIVGPFSGAGSFSYTVKVTGPGTAGATGQFTINSSPTTSSSSNSPSGTPCTSVNVYLKTPPAHGAPEFPAGMGLMLAIALPAMLLMRGRFKVAQA